MNVFTHIAIKKLISKIPFMMIVPARPGILISSTAPSRISSTAPSRISSTAPTGCRCQRGGLRWAKAKAAKPPGCCCEQIHLSATHWPNQDKRGNAGAHCRNVGLRKEVQQPAIVSGYLLLWE